ncbi:MAG: polyprenyl diphosphate synthase [Planctomycetota bacterium]
MQSALVPLGWHVGIIMDGNGRWAIGRGEPRSAGHRAGAGSVRRIIEACPGLDIGVLTLYAFSSDNWARPRGETQTLFRILADAIRDDLSQCVEDGVRLEFVGRRDRLPPPLVTAMQEAERRSTRGRKLLLRIAIDYSSRDAIFRAARALPADTTSHDDFVALIREVDHARTAAPPVDLIIRTGGEQRLSDFLLWESAYAELYFTPCHWPAFGPPHLEEAITTFRRRDRRYGQVI